MWPIASALMPSGMWASKLGCISRMAEKSVSSLMSSLTSAPPLPPLTASETLRANRHGFFHRIGDAGSGNGDVHAGDQGGLLE